jgi:hypothetical protein
MALGTFPDVSLEKASARDEATPRLLAADVDPSLKRQALRQRPTHWPRQSVYKAGDAGNGTTRSRVRIPPLRRINRNATARF